MKTFNRGQLKRLALKGRLLMKNAYQFDDGYGETRHDGGPIPVRVVAPGEPRPEGVCCIRADEFDGRSGGAAVDEFGNVTLYVHSNKNYQFVILPEDYDPEELLVSRGDSGVYKVVHKFEYTGQVIAKFVEKADAYAWIEHERTRVAGARV